MAPALAGHPRVGGGLLALLLLHRWCLPTTSDAVAGAWRGTSHACYLQTLVGSAEGKMHRRLAAQHPIDYAPLECAACWPPADCAAPQGGAQARGATARRPAWAGHGNGARPGRLLPAHEASRGGREAGCAGRCAWQLWRLASSSPVLAFSAVDEGLTQGSSRPRSPSPQRVLGAGAGGAPHVCRHRAPAAHAAGAGLRARSLLPGGAPADLFIEDAVLASLPMLPFCCAFSTAKQVAPQHCARLAPASAISSVFWRLASVFWGSELLRLFICHCIYTTSRLWPLALLHPPGQN